MTLTRLWCLVVRRFVRTDFDGVDKSHDLVQRRNYREISVSLFDILCWTKKLGHCPCLPVLEDPLQRCQCSLSIEHRSSSRGSALTSEQDNQPRGQCSEQRMASDEFIRYARTTYIDDDHRNTSTKIVIDRSDRILATFEQQADDGHYRHHQGRRVTRHFFFFFADLPAGLCFTRP